MTFSQKRAGAFVGILRALRSCRILDLLKHLYSRLSRYCACRHSVWKRCVMFNTIVRNTFLGFCMTLIWTVGAPIAQASDLPHGHDCATAKQVQPEAEEVVAFANASDRAVYRVVLDERGLLDVRADFGSPAAANVTLLDSSCSPIRPVGSISVMTGTVLTTPSNIWTLGPGTYFVRFEPVGAKLSGNSFSFGTNFTAHYGHDCSTAEPMKLSASNSASRDGE